MGGLIWEGLEWGWGPDMGGLILYGACNGGPGIVRNVPNPGKSHIFPGLGYNYNKKKKYIFYTLRENEV